MGAECYSCLFPFGSWRRQTRQAGDGWLNFSLSQQPSHQNSGDILWWKALRKTPNFSQLAFQSLHQQEFLSCSARLLANTDRRCLLTFSHVLFARWDKLIANVPAVIHHAKKYTFFIYLFFTKNQQVSHLKYWSCCICTRVCDKTSDFWNSALPVFLHFLPSPPLSLSQN